MIVHHEIETSHGKIRGYEHRPAISKGKVFIQHGYFSSTHLGPNRLYWQIAESLRKANFTVYRFACIGMGDSDREFEETSYQLHIDNNTAVINSFRDSESKLILIGHSMGSSIAVRLATTFRPRCLILISPSLGKIDKIENLFTAEQLLDLQVKGETERKGLIVSAKFMRNSQDEGIFDYCSEVESKVQVHYGLCDELFNIDSAKNAAQRLEGKLNLYPNADHNFLESNARGDMIKYLIDFLVNEQVPITRY